MSSQPPKSTLILLDLGLVVVDVELSTGRAAWQELCGGNRSDFDRLFFDSGIKYRMDIGELSGQSAIDEIGKAVDYKVIPDVIEASWNAVLTARPAMSAAIRALSRTYRCDVISNTDPIHAAWIQKNCGIMDAVTKWTFSFDSGHMKPQKALFEVALEAAQIPATQVLLLDDRRDNVATAQALGMDTIVVQSEAQALAELQSRGFDIGL